MQRVLPVSPGASRSAELLLEAAEALLLAGVRQLLVREPLLSSGGLRDFLSEVVELDALVLHECCEDAEGFARLYGCGLHLSSTTPIREVRQRFDGLLGVSTHGRDALLHAENAGADYAFLSPVYAPHSKPEDTRTPLGLERAVAAVKGVSIPVFFLGGINADRARGCRQAGAYGVAAIGAIFGADVKTVPAATALLEAMN